MNTLKKCILLGILILNLIPYMQDGKVKWTTTEVGAQTYICELYDFYLGYKCVNIDNSLDFFYDDNDDCIKSEPSCQSRSISTYMGCSPYQFNYDRTNWCVFLILESITGVNICDIAQDYYRRIDGNPNADCSGNTGADIYQLNTFFGDTKYKVNANHKSEAPSETICSLSSTEGVLVHIPNHTVYVYKIKKQANKNIEDVQIYWFDPFDQSFKGPSPITTGVNWSGSVTIVSKQI